MAGEPRAPWVLAAARCSGGGSVLLARGYIPVGLIALLVPRATGRLAPATLSFLGDALSRGRNLRTAANLHFRAAGGKRAAMLEKKHVRLLEAGTAAYGDMEHALFTSCAHGEVVESDSRFDPSDLPQPRTLELRPSLQGLRTNVRTVLLPMYCPLRPREKGTEFNGCASGGAPSRRNAGRAAARALSFCQKT